MVPELRGGSFKSPDKRQLMSTLTGFLETGQLRDRGRPHLPLSETAAALRYLVSGQPVGRVVIVVDD